MGVIDEDKVVKEEDLDKDGDGFTAKEDCDDENAQINPLAKEIPDNEIDENCDGKLGRSTQSDALNSGYTLVITPSDVSVEVSEVVNFQVELVDNEGNATDVTTETLITNPFSSKRSGVFTITATYEDLRSVTTVTVNQKKRCSEKNEEWNSDLAVCQCIDNYSRDEKGDCVRNSGTGKGNINTCLRDNEVWNKETLSCECISGFVRNANGKCVEKSPGQ